MEGTQISGYLKATGNIYFGLLCFLLLVRSIGHCRESWLVYEEPTETLSEIMLWPDLMLCLIGWDFVNFI